MSKIVKEVAAELALKLDHKIWKAIGGRGLVLFLLGLVLLIRPGISLSFLFLYMGIYWFIDGIICIYKSVEGRKLDPQWGMGIVSGLLGMLAGALVLSHPLFSSALSLSIFVWIAGLICIVSGISGLVTGIRLRKSQDNDASMILGGIISILFGILLISSPYVTGLVIIKIIGVIAIIAGLSLMGVAIRMRKKAKEKHENRTKN